MRVLKRIFLVLLVTGVAVAGAFAIVQMPRRPCEKMSVLAHSDNESIVLTQEDVENRLKEAGIDVIGKSIKDIELDKIRRILQAEPYVKNVDAIRFSGTQLHIEYTLYSPAVHVFGEDGSQFFADPDGQMLPFTIRMTDNLIVASGHIRQKYAPGGKVTEKALLDVMRLSDLIGRDRFCRAQFRQIYVNSRGELELSTALGNQNILFGNMEQAAEKLKNLKTVYCNGLPHKGFERYAQLDARYKNRIIAKYATEK